MTKNNEKAPSQRMLRMGELVRHALAEMFSRGEVHDPVLETHVITIPEVAMTPDLRHATAYVMPLGGKDERAVIDALNRNKKYMRGVIAKKIQAKFAPDLHFRIDERFDRADEIDKLLKRPEVQRDLHKDEDE
ncbi:MAG: 30S ribosome-binding factor RbfA [Xanthobacteraceae bacterium]|jgi:ribosome-binding factor A|nr:30S ribosome-binding factor RbfA [Xanthobacteraceae bacterium]MBX3534008.1 30S ribosome-binding factor RbfA [Xanthobacteraceae bacterium]MCW5673341.1 30S ribosome-binding factor RbfA [Xanthobacteraceae bacterium]MCW5677549.1 30S ribosome-binding factor RbfA [Xanthobacteraceae bacterium]